MKKNKENFKNNTTKKSKIKKVFKIFGFFVLFIVFIASVYLIDIYFKLKSGDIILWDNDVYTREEFAKKYPPQYYDVPAKNTPEEVYATFRQALLDGDIELALEQIVEKKREGYRKVFIVDSERFENWVKTLPENLTKESINGNFAYYDWNKNDGYKHTVGLSKNSKGFWEIENI